MNIQGRKRSFKPGLGMGGSKRSRAIKAKMRSDINRQIAINKSRMMMNPRVGGFIGTEVKFVDYAVTSSTLTTSMAFIDDTTALSLNGVAQGDDYNQRQGRKIKCLSVHVRGFITRPRSEAAIDIAGDELVRIILYLDTQANAAQGTAANVTANLVSHRDLQYTQRLKVLKDKTYRCPDVSNTQAAANDFSFGIRYIPFKMNVKLNFITKFVGTGATVAAIADNALHLIACNAGGTTSGNHAITYVSRVRYTDL